MNASALLFPPVLLHLGWLIVAASFALAQLRALYRLCLPEKTAGQGGGLQLFYQAGGEHLFRFQISPSPPGYRIEILQSPPYRGRAEDLHTTHRIRSGDRLTVCWDTPILRQEDAVQIAQLWAEKTLCYIQTGRTF